MEGDKEEKKEIIPSGCGSLTKYSSGLIKRGVSLAADIDLSCNPEALDEYIKRCIGLMAEGKHEAAERELRKVTLYNQVSGSKSSRAHVKLGLCRLFLGQCILDQGRYLEAEKVCRESIDLGFYFDELCCQLGRAIIKQGRLLDAESEYRKFIRMGPNSNALHNALGAVLSEQKKYEEAEREFRKAIQLKPNDPVSHGNLAFVLGEMGRHKEAMKEFREAVRLNPKDAEVRANYAAIILHKGDLKGAVKILKEAIIVDPNCTLALFVLAGALDEKGKRSEARQYWERLSKLKVQPDWVGLIKHRLSEPD